MRRPIEYRPYGATAGTSGTLTVANVHAPAGSLLYVYSLETETAPSDVGVVTWGSEALFSTNENQEGPAISATHQLRITGRNAGTRTVTLTSGAAIQAAGMLVAVLRPGTVPDLQNHGDGGVATNPAVASTVLGTHWAESLVVAQLFFPGLSAAVGTWDASLTARQGVAIPGAFGGWLEDASGRIGEGGTVFVASKTLDQARVYLMDISTFAAIPAPDLLAGDMTGDLTLESSAQDLLAGDMTGDLVMGPV